MSIEIRNETTITLSQAGQLLPPGRRGKRPSLGCVLRWVLEGVRLPSGEVVRLEAIRCGGRWITTIEALERFATRQTPRLDESPAQRPVFNSKARQKASKRAARELERAGI
jgi:hypothetical protein